MSLTPTQLIDIYTCDATTHNPIISDWHTVNSAAPVGSTIVKYAPQTSSGTYSFFNSNVLNGNTIDQNCSASHSSTFLEEHDARGVTPASKPNAIYAFDYARWTAQSKQFEADLRNGATLGQINGVAPSASTVNQSGTFIDSRWIYNVVRTDAHPSSYTTQTADVRKLIGVTASPSSTGYLCSGLAAPAITLAGFVPIGSGATGGSGNPNSTCRFEPTPIP